MGPKESGFAQFQGLSNGCDRLIWHRPRDGTQYSSRSRSGAEASRSPHVIVTGKWSNERHRQSDAGLERVERHHLRRVLWNAESAPHRLDLAASHVALKVDAAWNHLLLEDRREEQLWNQIRVAVVLYNGGSAASA
jgi:hypothetical protein